MWFFFLSHTVEAQGNFALQFDGSQNYVQVPYASAFYPSALTAECWVKSTGATGQQNPLIGNFGNASSSYEIELDSRCGFCATFYFEVDGALYQVGGGGSLNDSNWHHVALVWTGGNLNGFVDGVLIGSTATSGGIGDGHNSFYMGKDLQGFFAPVVVDEVRISQVARYSTNFTPVTGFSVDPNTVAYWKFNTGTGTTAFDETGNHDGTLIGSPPPSWVLGVGPSLVASFTATPTNGFAPLSVTFTDTSIGSITNWFWNFGDGGTTNLATSGVVYTYKTAGVYTVTEIVTGPDGVSSNVQPNYIIVSCPTITLSPNGANPTVLTGGTAGTAYSQTITASGGTPPYTYATTPGTLPPGLGLSSAGVLSGPATAAGTYTFTVTATDTNGCMGSQSYSLTMTCPTIMLSPATLSLASAGVYDSQTITASGGIGPYSYAETGTLPNGMGLSPGGVLSGISTETGLFPITITATDQFTGCTGSLSYTLRVDCPTITLSPSSLPTGTVGFAYSATITPNGGVASYIFLVSSGSLPTGLNLDSYTGVLSGTPAAAGTFTFGIDVYDANGCPAATSYTVQMNCPTITLSALSNGTVMTPYSQTITASGGTGPYTFSVLNGAVPSGLSLSSAGVLSGTPSTATNVTFSVLANDAYSCSGTQQYTVATFGIFEVTAITRETNDILVTWSCLGSHSYVLQSTKSTAMIAEYTTNFADASPTIVVSGLGPTTTNYLDAGAAYAPVLTAPDGTIVTTSVVSSTVSISAVGTRGITDSLGHALPIGSVLMLGTFSISEPTIQSNFLTGNVSAIMSNFAPYGTAFAVGDGSSLPASWSVSRSAPGFGGLQIYLLATDKPTLAAANHLGIYTAPSWTFPTGGGTNTIDLADVTDFVIGALGGSLTINLPVGGETYTFNDTAKLSVMPGRILFYRVRLAQ
jgi:PKD repeat protein